MRLFVAIKISEELQKEILEWERDYQRLPVRWIAGKNLHVTLIPPWESEEVGKISTALKALEGKMERSLEVIFKRVCYGPQKEKPRLIWAEGKAPKEIQDLKTEVEGILRQKPDSRPFKLHLTLARFNPRDFTRFPIKSLDEEVFWRQEVKSIVLVESRLLPEGAEYEVLEEIRLFDF